MQSENYNFNTSNRSRSILGFEYKFYSRKSQHKISLGEQSLVDDFLDDVKVDYKSHVQSRNKLDQHIENKFSFSIHNSPKRVSSSLDMGIKSKNVVRSSLPILSVAKSKLIPINESNRYFSNKRIPTTV